MVGFKLRNGDMGKGERGFVGELEHGDERWCP